MNRKTTNDRGRRAILLDRDGTLIPDVDYLTKIEEVELYPSTIPALARLREAGFLLIGITNQSAVARGMLEIAELVQIHDYLQSELGQARLDHIYFCPHHPTVGDSPWRVDCPCRKPKPGLLLKAATEWGLDLGNSWMIGDRHSDVEAGRRANCHRILIGNGDATTPGVYVAPDLYQAAEWILAAEENPR